MKVCKRVSLNNANIFCVYENMVLIQISQQLMVKWFFLVKIVLIIYRYITLNVLFTKNIYIYKNNGYGFIRLFQRLNFK